ncbi:MAG: hypothetical protein M1834_004354 [Cirrosporium novae-zelandiae]|nr:MAG: hypothetical protein M1834_004354 [Cirrosporium novae-zelandiae]
MALLRHIKQREEEVAFTAKSRHACNDRDLAPYSSPIIPIRVGLIKKSHFVHQSILQQSPVLASLCTGKTSVDRLLGKGKEFAGEKNGNEPQGNPEEPIIISSSSESEENPATLIDTKEGILPRTQPTSYRDYEADELEYIELPDISVHIFQFILDFLYSATYSPTPTMERRPALIRELAEVYIAAAKLRLPALQALTIAKMRSAKAHESSAFLEISKHIYGCVDASEDQIFRSYFRSKAGCYFNDPSLSQEDEIYALMENGGLLARDIYIVQSNQIIHLKEKIRGKTTGSSLERFSRSLPAPLPAKPARIGSSSVSSNLTVAPTLGCIAPPGLSASDLKEFDKMRTNWDSMRHNLGLTAKRIVEMVQEHSYIHPSCTSCACLNQNSRYVDKDEPSHRRRH